MQPDTTAPSPEIQAFVGYMTIGRNKSPRTAAEYARDLARFQRFIAPAALIDATTEQIELWRDALRVEGRNQPQSVRRKLAACSAFFRWRVKKKLRLDNPCDAVELPTCGKPLPKVMTEDEAQILMAATVHHRRHRAFLDARDRAMMEVLYGSGLRRFEATGLDIADVDLVSRKVHVRHGKGDKARYSYLSEPAVAAIQAYLPMRAKYTREGSGTALFLTIAGDRITPRQLWCVFKRLREAAREQGLTKHVVPHTMRHSFATHIYRRSRNIRAVQKLLGHASINTTERYTHIEDDELREIYEAAHPRAKTA